MFGRILVLVMIGALTIMPQAMAAETTAIEDLSFADFTQKVLAYYPKLKSADSNVDIALARQMQAKAGFWPSLDVSAGYKVTDDPVAVFGMLLRQDRFTSADFDLKRMNTPGRHQGLTLGAHVQWPLFDAMQTIHHARAARERVKSSELERSFTGMEARLMAQDVYANAVLLTRALRVAEAVRSVSEEDLKKAQDLKDRGQILGADYYSARVMFGSVTKMVNEFQRQHQAMGILLNIMMGESLDKEWSLPDHIPVVSATDGELAGLLDEAYAGRLDLQALQLEVKAAREELAGAHSSILPQVNAFGDLTGDRDRLRSAAGTNYTVGVKAEMSVFDPARKGNIAQQKARVERLDQELQLFKDMITRDLSQEFSRRSALAENQSVVKGMMDDAREALDRMGPLYNEGRKSIADVLEVRRIYLQTVLEQDRAAAELWMSEGRVLFMTGQLGKEGAGL